MKGHAARWIYRLIGIALGGLFALAGMFKLRDMPTFVDHIAEYGLVYEPLLGATAVTLVALELAGGLALMLDRRGGLPIVVGLLVVFVAVLSYGIALGLDIDCGCLGPGLSQSLPQALTFDLLLLSLAVYLIVWQRYNQPQTASHATSPTGETS